VAAIVKRAPSGGAALVVEVLAEVNGLSAADLARDITIELAPGERYRTPSPLVLLKAKLYNLASLVGLDRPQDLKHTRMLLLIVPEYLSDVLAGHDLGEVELANVVGAVDYAREVVQSGASRNAADAHRLDLRQIIPASLRRGPTEVQSAVRRLDEAIGG
jgi:hypothetical protein